MFERLFAPTTGHFKLDQSLLAFGEDGVWDPECVIDFQVCTKLLQDVLLTLHPSRRARMRLLFSSVHISP